MESAIVMRIPATRRWTTWRRTTRRRWGRWRRIVYRRRRAPDVHVMAAASRVAVTAIEVIATARFGRPAISRFAKWRGSAAGRRRGRRTGRMRIVVAAMIPNDAMIPAVTPYAMALVAMVVMVMVMVMVAIMIAIMVVIVMMVMEESPTPGIEPDESVVDVEIVILWRSEPADAGVVRPVASPFVHAPVAADPVVIIALPIAIVERSAIPLAVEIDRAVSDGIIPEIVRAACAVAVAPCIVGISDAVARTIAVALGARRHARKQ